MNTNLQISEQALPLGSIEAYIGWARQIPILSAEEEYALATKLKVDGDLEAARRLILAHLRFVVYITRGYLGYGLAQADLIQEGNIGLMKAVKRFDPKLGVRLISFAVHWIKAEIHEFILRNWRIVRMATTKAQRKLFFNLRKMAHKKITDIAKELNVQPEEVISMEMRLNSADIAFDGFDSETQDNHAPLSLTDQSLDSDPALHLENGNWDTSREQVLALALEKLDPRSKDILECRWLKTKKSTLQELASKYKVSIERIRQLEENTLKKLKQLVNK